MNKKGFTLIEVIVSIVLVGLVMTSLLATLVQIKDAQSIVHENSDAIIYSSSIARIINNDIIENNGIRYLYCGNRNSNSSCDMVLGNGKKRRLEIQKVEFNNIFSNETNITDESGETTKITTTTDKIYTTLKYTDGNDNIIYIKTLVAENSHNNDSDEITSNNYIFSNELAMKKFNLTNKSDSNLEDRFFTITIKITSDDKNKEAHELTISSAGTYDPNNPNTNTKYRIDLDNSAIKNLSGYNDLDTHKFFVESYYDKFYLNEYLAALDENKLKIPTITNYNVEYYTKKDGGTKIVDSSGLILVAPTYFDSATTIYARAITK